MAEDGVVTSYNAAESRLSGLRYDTGSTLDVVVDYVFTLRMQPTKVRLRLLKQPDGLGSYLVAERA